ncbi:diguanylate cyclase domain-containing protein [Bacillus sinesaloumensis]|uniref:sensor domain-containing diguanylate cyclase n=1 Tax=Litchfieldia sinesaloumensis TaxID=1926280 RepID=UPI0013565E75|nr:diguanylate cyclase [Bacillus sinesaloumensis]
MSSHGNYTTEYHIGLVILSILIGIFTSYVAIQIVIRHEKIPRKDVFWLISSSFVMGGGVWAVHFIGMLAVHIKVTVTYNIWIVLASLFLIVTFSMLAFSLISKRQTRRSVTISSCLMGLGIFSMHFLSMRSMEMEANLTYSTVILLFSLLAAIIGSWITFWLFSNYRDQKWFGIVGAITLGSGIAGMHYIGMSATTFEKMDFHHQENASGYVLSGYTIASAITIFILTLLVLLLYQVNRDERLRNRLLVSEEHYKRLVELAPVGITIHKFGIIHYINPAGITILAGNNSRQFVGRHFLDFIHPDYHHIIKNRWNALRKGIKSVEAIEEQMIRLDKQSIYVEVSASPYEMDGESYVQVFYTEITARKEAEEMMVQLAFHDALSGLPNRRFFAQELNKAVAESGKLGQRLSVLFLDLDGFKAVNDTYGHDVGDSLIQEISMRLKKIVPKKAVLSRLGGDEFTIFLPDTTTDETKGVAESIIHSIQQPVSIQDVTVHVTSSIGIAFFPEDSSTAGALVKSADEAMFQAKKTGKNQYHFYSSEIQ